MHIACGTWGRSCLRFGGTSKSGAIGKHFSLPSPQTELSTNLSPSRVGRAKGLSVPTEPLNVFTSSCKPVLGFGIYVPFP